jgi:hypothetical protein
MNYATVMIGNKDEVALMRFISFYSLNRTESTSVQYTSFYSIGSQLSWSENWLVGGVCIRSTNMFYDLLSDHLPNLI